MQNREFTFNADCLQVKEDLRGATIEKDNQTFTVVDSDAYPRELNQGKKYTGVRSVPPGCLVGTFHMGSSSGDIILPLASTANEGCVAFTELKQEEEGQKLIFKGSGLISKTLGIRRGEIYTLEIVQPTIPPILKIV